MQFDEVAGWAVAGAVLVGLAATYVRGFVSVERGARLRLLARRRARAAERVAIEASLDEPEFGPERIRTNIAEVLELARSVWEGRKSPGLGERGDAALIRAWCANRASWLGAGLRPVGVPKVDILRVVNREGESDDRVIARVRFAVHRDPRRSAVLPGDQTVLGVHELHLDERWTFVRDGEEWLLVSIDGDPLGGPVLTAPLIPSPAPTAERLEEDALRELTHPAPETDVSPGDLVDTSAPPSLKLLDLSVVDERFSSLLIAAAIKHVLEAWVEAGDNLEEPVDRGCDRSRGDLVSVASGGQSRATDSS